MKPPPSPVQQFYRRALPAECISFCSDEGKVSLFRTRDLRVGVSVASPLPRPLPLWWQVVSVLDCWLHFRMVSCAQQEVMFDWTWLEPEADQSTQLKVIRLVFVISSVTRPLSRRIPPPQLAGTLPRRRRRKKFSAPPRQPKFTDAGAAAIFAARRCASDFNSLWHMQQLHYEAIK